MLAKLIILALGGGALHKLWIVSKSQFVTPTPRAEWSQNDTFISDILNLQFDLKSQIFKNISIRKI